MTLNYLFRYLTYRRINTKLKIDNVIYVKTDESKYFLNKLLPKIKQKFILVTGDSDFSSSTLKDVLKNPYLIHWFAQNNDILDNKVTIIPIGLDLHILISSPYFQEQKKDAKQQESELNKIVQMRNNNQMKVLVNFHLNYTSSRRKELHDLLKGNKNVYFQKQRLSRTELWKLQKRFAFNFSPVGNGLDCPRTWESLILGQIPIVEKTNTPLDDLHKQFPIVIINDVSEINDKNLKKWYEKYSKMFTLEMKNKLTNSYWVKKIKSNS